MTEVPKAVGLSGFALVPICCLGVPLLLATGLSVADTPAGAGRERRPLVEVLSFAGCPNHQGAIALVERVSAELGLKPEIRVLDVPDQEAAQRLRFLGSPTIRIGGHDVDPDTEERSDYALSCRVFRSEAGITGQPDERWVRQALLREARGD